MYDMHYCYKYTVRHCLFELEAMNRHATGVLLQQHKEATKSECNTTVAQNSQ